MDIILLLIMAFSAIDLVLIIFHKLLKLKRRNNSKKMVINPGIKIKMLSTISDMNKKLNFYENSTVDKRKYLDLARKYNILLNSHRELNKKNETLKYSLEKLKQKIY